ncbi:PilZ domain-containing protein [Neptunicella marina]|uniref:PilZ domain-containing protein n=1 Tax=Neptunicella marina TaxID=2125989 RepID=A0A8J6ISY9_9ALTE|nr:PilZ domain-containing protein [Neptunicella marina]MBC3765048.1 PilZ domain-containing protein [Neptunicella marina]
MAQEFEQYQDILEQLKPVINEPDFNNTLSSIAANVSKPKRFLIKMELRRQARPCEQIIDLRGLVDGRCGSYEYGGLTHFLDPIAIEVFERQIRAFGHYTVGVYEAVNNTENNFRVMHQKELNGEQITPGSSAEAQHAYPTRIINFRAYRQRQEERMNFVVNIELVNQFDEHTAASTMDVSVNGLKVKVRRGQLFQPHESLHIYFRGLSIDHNSMNIAEGVPYEIIAVDKVDEDQILTLCRTHTHETPKFDAFLERFIQGNKRRYKVNMENTIEAITSKGYEQYYIPQFNSLPVFIEQQQEKLIPRFALTNDGNREHFHYWCDESGQLRIEHLFHQQRLNELLEQREIYVYAFNRINKGKTFFYSASAHQLHQQELLKTQFLGYGSRKASWRVYKLQLLDINPEQSFAPLSLPDELGPQVKKLNTPPPARLMAKLIRLKYIALLTDITEDWNTIAYQKYKFNKSMLPNIKPFAHPRVEAENSISMHRFKYQNLRTEDRFQLRSKVELDFDGEEILGVTEDISVHGVKIELDTPFKGRIFDEVELSFPQLQKISQKYPLHGLVYEVKNINHEGTILHLNAVQYEEENTAQLFFDQLIKANRDKLKSYMNNEEHPGIGEALRNMYAANIVNIPFYLGKDGVKIHTDAVGHIHDQAHAALPALSHQAEYGTLNLYPLFAASNPPFLFEALKTLKNNSPAIMRELFIAFNPDETDYFQSFKVKFVEQFDQDAKRREFIAQALGGGQFIALKVFLTKTGRPDTELLRTEMNYIGVYAMHKAKQLEEHLWSVAGVGNLIDITGEVLLRYGFEERVF